MAIREYGESILRRQSAKRDERESQERKRERRASKNEMKKVAAVWLGQQAWGAANSAIERKTEDLIKNSKAYDTKVQLGQAETYVNEYNAFKDSAKTKGTSIEDEILRDTATKQVAQYGATHPNSVIGAKDGALGNTSAMISYFMKQDDIIQLAADRTSFYTDVGAFSTDFLKGKSETPLQGLINKRTPKNALSYLARSVTGRIPSAEVFNAEIDELIQVQAANGILTRKSEAIKNAVFEGALTPDEARIFMPELEDIQKDPGYDKAIRLLDTTTLMDSQTGLHFEGGKVYRKQLSQKEDFRGNIVSTGFEFVEIEDIDLTEPLTTDDIVKMSGEVSDLHEHASKILNAQGFNDYSKATAALLRTFDGKVGTAYLLAASGLLHSQKFTDPKNYKLDVSPEKLKQMYFLQEEIIKATSLNLVNLSGRKNNIELQIKRWQRENLTLSVDDLQTHRVDLFDNLVDAELNLNAALNQRRKQLEEVRASYFETTTVTPKTSVDLNSTAWTNSENWAVEKDEDGTRRLYNRDNNEYIYFIRGTNQVQDENGVIRVFTPKQKLGVPAT